MIQLLARKTEFTTSLTSEECEAELRQLRFLRNVRDSRSRRYLIQVDGNRFSIEPEPKIAYTREHVTYVSANGALTPNESGTTVSLEIHPVSTIPPGVLVFSAAGTLFILFCATVASLMSQTIRGLPVSLKGFVVLAVAAPVLLLAVSMIGITLRGYRQVAAWLAEEVEYRLTVGPDDRAYVVRPLPLTRN